MAARLSVMAAAAVSAALVGASSAAAAYDDSFEIYTEGWCGMAAFVDYGPGAEGGGNNDDYVLIHDYCGDYHGVKAWAWQNGNYLGSSYLGTGVNTSKVWDPFFNNNVSPGDSVKLKVCLVDGADDPTPFYCNSLMAVSQDG